MEQGSSRQDTVGSKPCTIYLSFALCWSQHISHLVPFVLAQVSSACSAADLGPSASHLTLREPSRTHSLSPFLTHRGVQGCCLWIVLCSCCHAVEMSPLRKTYVPFPFLCLHGKSQYTLSMSDPSVYAGVQIFHPEPHRVC